MVICGGAIGGYWETGRVFIASRPTSITIMARTQAKIGLSMKNLAIVGLLYFLTGEDCLAPAAGCSAGLLPKGTALTGVPGRAR